MLDKWKIIRYVTLAILIVYLCIAFITVDINFLNWGEAPRVFFIFFSFVASSFVIFIPISEWFYDKKDPAKEVPKMKRYVGELREELQLIHEAYELEKKVDEFRIRNKK